jgi:hypothetical protein
MDGAVGMDQLGLGLHNHGSPTDICRDLGLPLPVCPKRPRAHPRWPGGRSAVGRDLHPLLPQPDPCPRGGTPAWEDPDQQPDLLALAAGVVVRDRFPDDLAAVHRSLFTARHDEGGDLRDVAVVRQALSRTGTDADAVLAEVESGWPAKVIRDEHERAVSQWGVFGVPTFIVGESAVFVRLMSRPQGDGELARGTIDRVLGLVSGHPDLNEFKHTRLTR